MTSDIETAVIGGGAVGLAIARRLALAGHDVLVIEKEDGLGRETSSRNSQVVHAGLYYPPQSLKARLCVSGKNLLYKFCSDTGVPVLRTGKLIVASSSEQVPRLKDLAGNAERSGVRDLQLLSDQEARDREPNLRCTAALYSPSSGVLDCHAYVMALEAQLSGLGAAIALKSHVTGIEYRPSANFKITAGSGGTSDSITADRLVIAAGHHATSLAKLTAGTSDTYEPPETRLAKGHYFQLHGPAPFRHLVYPLPGPASLGVHFTRDVYGAARFGPDIAWTEMLSYRFDDADERRAAFVAQIKTYWPEVDPCKLQPADTGIRPKLSRPCEPSADFAIHFATEHGIPGLAILYGIESPGLTASLAIADYVADNFAK